MGHVALSILQHLVKNDMVAGIHVKGEPDEVVGCPMCMQVMFTRFPFSSSEATAKAPLDEVVMDVVGRLKLGAAGAEYFLTILDVYTRMTLVYVLSKKSDVAETVKTDWLSMVERQQNRLVKSIRTDRGGEFLSKEFRLWLKNNGIRHSLSMPYSPAMNGIIDGSTTKRQSSLVNGGEEAKDAEEEEEEVQQVSERAPTLPSRTTSAPRIRVTPQQRHECLHIPAAEEEGRGKRRIQAPNRLNFDALGKQVKSALAGAAMMVGDNEESEYEEFAFAFFSPVEMPRESATLKEALESSDAEEWKNAMESELKSIEENGTWELVELPEGRKAITSKWLLKIMSDADGKIERYKSRLVAKGYQQKEKVDYKEMFAPVVKPTTLRTLLVGATIKGWVVKQMDVTTAFLNGILGTARGVMLKLRDKFKCKALGDVNCYLGLHIKCDVQKRCMRVHQRKYLEALAANFGQTKGHVATPFPSGFKCVKQPVEESVGEEERRRFHSLVGSLMYATVAAGMRLAKYLCQTLTVGLQYSAAAQRRQKGVDGVEPGRLFLTAFSDASYALEPEDMTSVGGFICCVGGGPTAWESKKQVDQALSSVESEYMALFRAVWEIVWQRRLLAELGEEQQGPTALYCGSQGAIALAWPHKAHEDEDGGGVSANDVAAHGRAAPLVAPRSAGGRLGPQLPGAVDAAAGDDTIPAADHEVADLSLARVWGCMAQFLGWELLDTAYNWVVTTLDVVFYENMSLEVWKSKHGPASGRTPTIPPTDTSTATLPLLAEVGEPAAEDVKYFPSPFPSPALRAPPLVADLRGHTLVSASGDEGRSGASLVAPAKSIAGGRRDVQQVDVRVKSSPPGEEQAEEVQLTVVKSAMGAGTRQQLTGEQAAAKPTKEQSATRQSAEEPTTGEKSAGKPAEVHQDDEGSEAGDDGGDAEESTDSDVVEVQRGPRQSGRIRRPPDFYVLAAFTTAYDKVDDDL
ncbi:unnamed protein product [Closterium sp. NIES-54]